VLGWSPRSGNSYDPSVLESVGVVIFYQVVSQIFMVLGQKAYLPPIIAGLAPTIVLAAYVWYNINKFK